MAEHFLQRAHIHTVLQHEGRRRMPQFMCGILAGIQPRTSQILLNHDLYRIAADARAPIGEKHSCCARRRNFTAYSQIAVERFAAGIIEVNDTLFVALAKDTQTVSVVVLEVQTNQLRDAQTAVEKNTQDAIITFLVFPIHGRQQPLALFQCEIVGERLWDLWGIKILYRIFLQQLRFYGQVFEEAADRRDFARTGVGAQAVFRLMRIWLLDTVTRQIGQKTINLRERHCAQKGNINISDRDFIEFRRARYEPAIKLQKPQEHPQIEIILIDRSLGMSADRFMINQKVAQHLRRIRIVHTQHLNF